MSEKAPLENRFGETVRSRGARIQFGDQSVMLIARENEPADDVILERVESFIVANQLLREVGRS